MCQIIRQKSLYLKCYADKVITNVQIGKGRPSPNTQYREEETIHYRLEWSRNEAEIQAAQRTDGLFPMLDNTDLEPIEVLRTEQFAKLSHVTILYI